MELTYLDMPVEPIPGHPNYFASEDGRVFSAARRTLRPLTQTLKDHGRDGYWSVRLSSNGVRREILVHKCIAITFLGPRPSSKHQVRHLDGDSWNNAASNLAWGTSRENHADRIRHGRSGRGEANPSAVLTEEQVRQAFAMCARGESKASVARHFGVSEYPIFALFSGKTWKHLGLVPPFVPVLPVEPEKGS
jgi:hypothetical protein